MQFTNHRPTKSSFPWGEAMGYPPLGALDRKTSLPLPVSGVLYPDQP